MTDFFDIYIQVKPEQYKNHKVVLLHDSGDILPLSDNENTFYIGMAADKVVVLLRLSNENMESFLENVPEGVSPFSYEGAAAMGLSNSYIGHTWEEVQARFPDLTTPTEKVDSDGNKYWSSVLQDTTIL